ncbi:type VI secretion system protein TssL, long form, partial [Plastoroseomonas hellenica]|uniref:type VI secretion system protein TssL, long form n=1 Tax=Plastoroseomonas hellenica TaxID=2687306 RepID=UPI001BA50A7D
AGPAPGGAPARAESAPRLAGEAEAMPKVGIGALAAAAAPLLDLLARVAQAGMASQPNADDLRERAVRAFRQFEVDARDAEIPPEQLRAAHYLICASLDDVVLAQSWGIQSNWSTRSLVSTFHQEVKSGDRFFDVLAGMQKEPGRWLGAMEVAYLCLALGFQGRYRLSPRGASELDRIREGLYQLLAQLRGAWERELSPRWRGEDAPHRGPARGIPAWVAACVAIFGLGMGWYVLNNYLNDGSDNLYERMAALPPGRLPEIERAAPPVPPAPPPPAPTAIIRPDPQIKLREFLKPEIDSGQVTIFGDGRTLTVRISNRGMFASGSATLEPRFNDLMRRIGEGLREEPGRVQVVGHSDNQPIRTVRFPSNFQLSTARAEAAMALIAAAAGSTSRFTAEGRADSEPVEPNTTPAGREANRRIEVVLQRGTN